MKTKDFTQAAWDEATIDDCRQLIRLWAREDLSRGGDLTTLALVPRENRGVATVVCRQRGVIVGQRAAELAVAELRLDASWRPLVEDGDIVDPNTPIAEFSGQTRDLLTAERLLLNFLGKLSGIATLTHAYVNAVHGTGARVYDTRKTTPGWRRLEKYAVRRGGGYNHRVGLYDAVLIKDNHLAQGDWSVADAVTQARRFLRQHAPESRASDATIVEIEVDTLRQLRDVLPASPDIVLLDNMRLEDLREAVAIRNRLAPDIQLEASGGIDLATITEVARTGVERISVGALTHAARSLDLGLDWGVVAQPAEPAQSDQST